MSWNGTKLRGAITKKRTATSTALGTRLVKGLANGAIIDRNQVQPRNGPRKRVAVPDSLARFFKPMGGA